MTPRLSGRLQTRIVVTLIVGGLWAALVTPVLPRPTFDGRQLTTGDMYAMTFTGLAVVTGLGLVWELVYHGLQQLRWDRDWPSIFGLVTVVNEGVTTWLGLHAVGAVTGPLGPSSPFLGVYVAFFVSTWVVLWLFVQGPIRVFSLRWRYHGGRFL